VEPCALCQNRDAMLGRVCDPCSQGLLSVLFDVERDTRDLVGVGDLLGAVKAKGDPYSYRGSRGFGSSAPADLRVIAARDPRTRPSGEPGERSAARRRLSTAPHSATAGTVTASEAVPGSSPKRVPLRHGH